MRIFTRFLLTILAVHLLSDFQNASAEPILNRMATDMVDVGEFYIDIFEMSCERQNLLKPSSCDFDVKGKPSRLRSFEQAKELCELEGKRVPTTKEWMLAASNRGRNRNYSLRDDKLVSPTGNILANTKERQLGQSSKVSDHWVVGVDSIGTVGMTGNRLEITYDPASLKVFGCGGDYLMEAFKLTEMCLDDTKDWQSGFTVRCVVDKKLVDKVVFSGSVSVDLQNYILDKLKLANGDLDHSDGSSDSLRQGIEDRFIGRNNSFSGDKGDDAWRLRRLDPYYIDNYSSNK